MTRPDRAQAIVAVSHFLGENYRGAYQIEWNRLVAAGAEDLAHDGEEGWSFSVLDRIGYVNANRVEGLY